MIQVVRADRICNGSIIALLKKKRQRQPHEHLQQNGLMRGTLTTSTGYYIATKNNLTLTEITVIRMKEMKKARYLDIEERDLAQSLEKEEWISDLTKREKRQYEEYARYSLNKQKRINIRMSERDLKKIRAKAIEEGIPYQSLISMLIHKYNEGKVSINH